MLAIIAGLSTTIGSAIAFIIKNPSKKVLSFAMGFSAGVMLFVSFAELLPEAMMKVGELTAFAAFFAGMILIYLIDVFVPHSYEQEGCDPKLMKCGKMVAVGIAIHNFPEGIAVLFASLSSLSLGIPIAIAIALHNIPEGIAVSMPVYYATKSKRKAFKYSFLSGLAEPVGAIIALIFLLPFINEFVLNIVLAAVAGVMVFISFDELLPISYRNNIGHVPILGTILGMAVMALSLLLL